MWVFGSCLPLSASISWDELSPGQASEPSAKAGWGAAARSYPAFAASQFDLPEKTETYRIFRHPGGGLRISGWSCQGNALPVRRAAIGCILNRLILPIAGNEPELAELFARAELKRGSCAASATSPASIYWVTSAENLGLRGTL
jgi:hypothetical protein